MVVKFSADKTYTKVATRLEFVPLKIINGIDKNGLSSKTPPELSVVIPIYNEADNIPILYQELIQAMEPLEHDYEIIFVDDGSLDGSDLVLRRIAIDNNRVKVIHFRRNYGQSAALAAGFDLSQGEVIITLDGDLQNDPRDIPYLLAKMSEGYDLVSGWRKDRKDNALTRKIPSKIANRIIAKLTNIKLNDYGCTLKAYKKGIIKNIKLYGEMHRFIPALANFLGIKVAEIPVNHRPRIHGVTKYGIDRTYRVILDLINVRFLMDYFTRPIQFFGKLSLFAFSISLSILLGALSLKYLSAIPINMMVVLIIEVITVLTGVQLIMMGLVGEIVIRTYLEERDKPVYIAKELINVE